MYFCKIKNLVYGEINERGYTDPHLRQRTHKSKMANLYTCQHSALLLLKVEPADNKETGGLMASRDLAIIVTWYLYYLICSCHSRLTFKSPWRLLVALYLFGIKALAIIMMTMVCRCISGMLQYNGNKPHNDDVGQVRTTVHWCHGFWGW